MKGLVLAFEGPHQSGKDTQAILLKKYLKSRGFAPIIYFEPTGSIKRNLDFIKKISRLEPNYQVKEFCQAREQLHREIIQPKIDQGNICILVRTIYSLIIQKTLGADEKLVSAEQKKFLKNGKRYDWIFFLDLCQSGVDFGCQVFGQRINQERKKAKVIPGHFFRDKNAEYHRKLIAAYHELALELQDNEGYSLIDATTDQITVAAKVRKTVDELLVKLPYSAMPLKNSRKRKENTI